MNPLTFTNTFIVLSYFHLKDYPIFENPIFYKESIYPTLFGLLMKSIG